MLVKKDMLLADAALHPEELRMKECPSDYHQRWWSHRSRGDVDHARL